MGQEIGAARFKQKDFSRFLTRLEKETQLLGHWLRDSIAPETAIELPATRCGYELEAWIVDDRLRPAPVNTAFMAALNNALVTPELASFNVEFNFTPQDLTGTALGALHKEMTRFWQQGRRAAQQLGCELAMIGILPTVRDEDLTTRNISTLKRYQALNEQVLRLRRGRPLVLDIHGNDRLRTSHMDVMLESVTTSFQIHMQTPKDLAVRLYNASIIASAPMVAVSANSPYLFGKDLWAETRIPVFEQSVEVGGYEDGAHGPMRRVTFGSGYVRDSIMACFVENLEHYPILLPTLLDTDPEQLSHLRLHNGTLWRWNRPLIGIENGDRHIRIEHRVVPAGPSLLDTCANAALFYGMAQYLVHQDTAPESQMPFEIARDNFYLAAKRGMDANITWLDGKKYQTQNLLLDIILPMARQGLEQLHIDSGDINLYLGVIQSRCENACNGATWQRAFVAKHGPDMTALTRAYLERQQSGLPVHEWNI